MNKEESFEPSTLLNGELGLLWIYETRLFTRLTLMFTDSVAARS